MCEKIRSANIHVIGTCNYRCSFCFTKNLDRGIMTPEQWRPFLAQLKKAGITKINIVGGEPTLYPFFIELCRLVKSMGFTLSIVSNGSRIDGSLMKKMKRSVDWIGLSIDSPEEEIERSVGRHVDGVNHIENVIKVADLAHEYGIRVKLNITVIRQSCGQDFTELIKRIAPERVKAFQVLRIEGENEKEFGRFSISEQQWKNFVKNHEEIVLGNGKKVVFESGEDMIDSYLMLDPLGRVRRDSGNVRSLNDFSVITADGVEAVVNSEKYLGRGGLYEWGSSE